jgi:hypothetical protein
MYSEFSHGKIPTFNWNFAQGIFPRICRNFPRNFSLVNSSKDPSPVKQNIRGVNIEKFLRLFPRICWNFSRICRNFSMHMSENFLRIFPKLITWNIQSKTPIFLRKNSELICFENFTRN